MLPHFSRTLLLLDSTWLTQKAEHFLMKQAIRKFLYIMGDRKKALVGLVLLIFLNSFLEAVGIGLIGPFIALVNNPDLIIEVNLLSQAYSILNFESVNQFVVATSVFIFLIFCLKSFFSFRIRRYIFLYALSHLGELQSRLLSAYLTAPYQFHLKNNTAFLIQNIVNETRTFCQSTLLEVLNSTVSLIMVVTFVTLLLLTDAISTLAASVILLIGFALVIHFRNKLSRWGKISSKSQAEMIRVVNHSLGGIKETRVIGCESYFEEQLNFQTNRYANACSSLMSFGLVPRLLIETLVIAFILGLASISLLIGRDTEHLISTLGVFGIVAIRLVPVATQLTSGFAKIRASSYVLEKLYFDLQEIEKFENKLTLDLVAHKQRQKPAQNVLRFQQTVNLQQISFQYSGTQEMALSEISLRLNKGESIALIGKSGAGKTTLVDLILGLLHPSSGDILVDGQSIYQDLRSWQNLIGYIPQSIFLIDDTLERNIAFGVPDEHIDYDRLWQAIAASQLQELVVRMPDGIKTGLGERGVRLSGGQRQRVGIARALYHEREILVLDEATSALDNETEQLVTKAIQSLSGKKTMIIIAHRLSTVEHCDLIYMMSRGKIVKSGSYQEVVLSQNL